MRPEEISISKLTKDYKDLDDGLYIITKSGQPRGVVLWFDELPPFIARLLRRNPWAALTRLFDMLNEESA